MIDPLEKTYLEWVATHMTPWEYAMVLQMKEHHLEAFKKCLEQWASDIEKAFIHGPSAFLQPTTKP